MTIFDILQSTESGIHEAIKVMSILADRIAGSNVKNNGVALGTPTRLQEPTVINDTAI